MFIQQIKLEDNKAAVEVFDGWQSTYWIHTVFLDPGLFPPGAVRLGFVYSKWRVIKEIWAPRFIEETTRPQVTPPVFPVSLPQIKRIDLSTQLDQDWMESLVARLIRRWSHQ